MEQAPDVAATFRSMLEALVVDAQAYEGGFSDDPDVRVILTAEDEWVKGPRGREAVARRRTQEIGLEAIDINRLEAFGRRDTGWAAADLVVHTGGGPVGLRVTAVFVLDGEWRVVQWHASSGIPNTQAWGVELTKSLDDLVANVSEDVPSALENVAPGGRITFLFSDIVDSTLVGADLGDAVWAGLISEHFAECRRIVLGNGGRVVKTLGDGAMAAFGSAEDAVTSGLEMHAATATTAFGIRVGVHSGPALRMGGDFFGAAVNKAARVAAAAGPGDLLVSGETAELLPDSMVLKDQGIFKLKGLPGTHRLFAVLPPFKNSRWVPGESNPEPSG